MNNRTLMVASKEIAGTPIHDLWDDENEIWHDGRYMTTPIEENRISGLWSYRSAPLLQR